MSAIATALATHVKTQPTSVAAVFHRDDGRNEEITWGSLEEGATKLQNGLRELGLRPGAVVGALLGNAPAFLYTWAACLQGGWTFAPGHTRWTSSQLGLAWEGVHPALVIADRTHADVAREAQDRAGLPTEGLIVVEDSEPPVVPHAVRASTVLQTSPTCPAQATVFTSGSTGRPKPVMLSVPALDAYTEALTEALEPERLLRSLVPVPLLHGGGLCVFLTRALRHGATIHVMESFDSARFGQIVADHHIQFTGLAPAMAQMLLEAEALDLGPDTPLEWVLLSGQPVSQSLVQHAQERWQTRVVRGYGCSEACSVISVPRSTDPPWTGAETDGRPIPGVEVAVINDDGPTESGVSGEILINGPMLMDGYLGMPEQTAEKLRNGWLHTGDVGYIGEDGHLRVTGRLGDMFISGGENIYPRDIEDALEQHPNVAKAAVVPVPHDRWGQVGRAWVVPKGLDHIQADELRAFLRSHLAGFQVPREIKFVRHLPTDAFGKVKKDQLRDTEIG